MWWFLFLCCIAFIFVYICYEVKLPTVLEEQYQNLKTKVGTMTRAFTTVVKTTMTSATFLPVIFQLIKTHDISLTGEQETLITNNLKRIGEYWNQGKPVKHLLEGLLSLVFPDFALVLQTSKMLFRFQSNDSKEEIKRKPTEEQIIALLEFGISEETILYLKQRELVHDLIQFLQTPEPKTCAITLDDLVLNGKLVDGVSMVLQHNIETQQKHIYLYQTEALNHWFSVQREQTNPVTRKKIDVGREVIVLR